ncbi:hypothetical protein [Slackia heliotrinireducens]|uniref:hypothetical protein n=1 Tax=Slackia heliotrinireducens TaxID=84110 RepID=UPI00331554BB
MADREYAEIFNQQLLAYNPLAPTVDPDRFARTCEVLGYDELVVLFMMGTQVPPDSLLIENRSFPRSVLESSFRVKGIKKDLVTGRELAAYFMLPVETVSSSLHMCPIDSNGYRMWVEGLFKRWDEARFSMAIRGVVAVARDKGMKADQARAVKVRIDGNEDGLWLACGQRVLAAQPGLDGAVEGTIESIDPKNATASIRFPKTGEALPNALMRLARLDWLTPLEDVAPQNDGTQNSSSVAVSNARSKMGGRLGEDVLQQQDQKEESAYNVVSRVLYSPYASVPEYTRLWSIRMMTDCDSETAFYVLGTQMDAQNVLLANRYQPRSAQKDAYILDELPADVVTVKDVADCYWQPIHMVRDQLLTCGYDLESEAAQSFLKEWKASRQRMRSHGIVVKDASTFDIYRHDGMGPNEAHAVWVAGCGPDDMGVEDPNGGDANPKLLIAENYVRVDRGAFAGLTGKLASIAPEDGLGIVSLEGDGPQLSAIVPLQDLTMFSPDEG